MSVWCWLLAATLAIVGLTVAYTIGCLWISMWERLEARFGWSDRITIFGVLSPALFVLVFVFTSVIARELCGAN